MFLASRISSSWVTVRSLNLCRARTERQYRNGGVFFLSSVNAPPQAGMCQATGSSQEVGSLLQRFSVPPTTCVLFPFKPTTPVFILWGPDYRCKIPQMQTSPEQKLLALCHHSSTWESTPGTGSQPPSAPRSCRSTSVFAHEARRWRQLQNPGKWSGPDRWLQRGG